jgi:hypothetical protein
MKPVKCAVFGLNSNGEPDIFFCKIKCTEEQYNKGEHYDKAKEVAEENCYDPILACDENDPAGKVVELFEWKSIHPSQIVEI